ncbi:MAG: hypothetical protein RI942_120 [Pseudomonadota bacterium]|jgi:hypothetical protein
MAESVNERVNRLADGIDRQELGHLLAAVVNCLQAVGAKLDADAGVTDTDYAATIATYVKD